MVIIEIGSWNKLPHYCVVGDGPQNFYIWVNENGNGTASKWIKGKKAFRIFNKIKKIKNKKQFVYQLKKIHCDF